MEESKKIETWSDIKNLREEKGISLFSISEKMRLPPEKIEFLENGDFSNADPVITRLQLKIYCRHLGFDYEEIVLLSGLKEPENELPTISLDKSTKIIKTRSYRGRKKEPSKVLIYSVIVIGVIAAIFLLNLIAKNLNITSDVFEMTELQTSSLDSPDDKKDITSFKPVLPQATKEEIVQDIIVDMHKYHHMPVSFPLKINIFPKETLSYRHEIKGQNPKEDFIMKNIPRSLFFSKPGRIIFYNTQNTRFVISGFAFRENDISRVLIEINEDREMVIYTK